MPKGLNLPCLQVGRKNIPIELQAQLTKTLVKFTKSGLLFVFCDLLLTPLHGISHCHGVHGPFNGLWSVLVSGVVICGSFFLK